jgi:tRNA (adenine57-N1/adenine58-N1)-methyltransferase catalytic subunit
LCEPTLAEYVCLTRRLVTPIYPDNAAIMVKFLDLHPSYNLADRIEILEAGTGHGALTLHIAQAIHGYNPFTEAISTLESQLDQSANDHSSPSMDQRPERYKMTRRAIIHSVDIDERHSRHAEHLIKSFRRGVYFGDVNFYVGNLSEFFATEETHNAQFLTHVILDMPSAADQLRLVSEHLKSDGVLLVFNPSVTQITECVKRVAQGIPLQLERVVELDGSFSGGRDWDIRLAKIRNPQKAKLDTNSTGRQSLLSRLLSIWARWKRPNVDAETAQNWAVVCRPKAGQRIPVGGFVGIWRRT